MKKGIVSGVVRNALPEGSSVQDMFSLAAECGFDGVELQAGSPPREFDENTREEDVQSIRAAAEKAGVEIFSVMPTAQNLGSVEPEERKRGIEILEKVSRLSAALGAGTVLIVPCRVKEDCPYDKAYQNSLEALRELAGRLDNTGITFSVENVWNKFLYSPLEFARYIDETARDNVRAYFDVGNIMINGFPEQWIQILGKRIDKVHVKDYQRDRPGPTGFCNLLEGDVPWPEVMKSLRETGYDGYITAEVSGYRTGAELGLKAIAAALDYIIPL